MLTTSAEEAHKPLFGRVSILWLGTFWGSNLEWRSRGRRDATVGRHFGEAAMTRLTYLTAGFAVQVRPTLNTGEYY